MILILAHVNISFFDSSPLLSVLRMHRVRSTIPKNKTKSNTARRKPSSSKSKTKRLTAKSIAAITAAAALVACVSIAAVKEASSKAAVKEASSKYKINILGEKTPISEDYVFHEGKPSEPYISYKSVYPTQDGFQWSNQEINQNNDEFVINLDKQDKKNNMIGIHVLKSTTNMADVSSPPFFVPVDWTRMSSS